MYIFMRVEFIKIICIQLEFIINKIMWFGFLILIYNTSTTLIVLNVTNLNNNIIES